MKKALSIILAIIMIVSVLPLTAFAESYADNEANGDGVFNLNNCARLKAVAGGTDEIDQSIER